jgi:GNAT superfamily N-acetyltransferase
VRLRPAGEADFPEMHEVMVAAEGGVRHGHGFAWEPPPLDVFETMHRHFLGTGPQRVWVAEDDERIQGFAAAWTRGDTWFLADLFVAPEAQGRGLGTALLARVWEGPGIERRMTLTTSIQPVSNTMYARRGLVPATPMLKLSGIPRAAAPDDLDEGEDDPEALAAIDLAAYGFDRTIDHAFWARTQIRTVWHRAGLPVAYSYAGGSRIGPVAGVDPAAAAGALTAELARAGREVTLDAPGSAREVVEAGLAAGLRLGELPGLVLLSEGVEPPRSLAFSGYWLA